MNLLNKYCNQTEFSSYDEFKNNFKFNMPEKFNFAYDVVDYYAEHEPNKRALLWCDDFGNKKEYSFKDLKEYSDKTANILKNYGIKKGDAVMLILKGRYEFWFFILALHKIGAVTVPATHMLKEHDIEYRVNRAHVKMIVSIHDDELMHEVELGVNAANEKNLANNLLVVDGEREGWGDYAAQLEETSSNWQVPQGNDYACNEDSMLLYFTSGTSGQPKMVQHDFAYPVAHIVTAAYWQNVVENGLHYTVSDTGWAKAVWGKIYGQWLAGSAVFAYDYDKFDALNLLRKASEFHVTTFCAPPTVYRFLIKQDLSQFDLSSLQYCAVAGEPLNDEVYNKFKEQTGIRLMEAFGQTELTVVCGNFKMMDPKPGSIGKPSPVYNVKLLKNNGQESEVGEEGEICICLNDNWPAGLFKGYYEDEEKTKAVCYDGYYHTQDLAWKDEDGYFWFVGRADDVIKSSGYRIGPFEVESALIQHPAVLECAITAVPHPDRGQVVKATIVLTESYQASDDLKKELKNHVKEVTAPYKYPRIIDFVDELPKTVSGKIRRVEIRNNDKNK